MTDYRIDFEPIGRRGKCRPDESLLDCTRDLGIGLSSICGGQGTCRSCKIQVVEGRVSEPTSRELETFSAPEIDDGWRLACQTYPAGDCKLYIPPESMTAPQRVQVEGQEIPVGLEPPVESDEIHLDEPSLSSPGADADRLLEALNRQRQSPCRKTDINVLRTLSGKIRSWKWELQAVTRDDELVAVLPAATSPLGLAIDLGTTKLAGYLIDLSNGRTLAARGTMNPQISYGEDIISRVTMALKSKDGSVRVQQAVVEAINELTGDLCSNAGASSENIVEAVIVGNTAMHHLFLGLPVKQLAVSPFVPAVSRAVDIKAYDLGIHLASGAYVHLLPNIAGFVGADHVAMLLASGAPADEGPVIALDIGTNTEVSLVTGGNITATSCASGPAFEGGHIKFGMRAAPGAIERLRIIDNTVNYQTIDQAPPAGICGSGILDTLSQLYLSGIIDEGGRITDSHPRVCTDGEMREFILVSEEERNGQPAITITQYDVRELQLAKAAIRTGIQALLDNHGCSESNIKQVIIAGAFGTYIDIASAVNIGMLPSIPLDRFRQVGNAAGTGAKMALVSLSKRREAQEIASRVNYIELAGLPRFNEIFIQAGYLGRYRLEEGKRKSVDLS